jgi:putative transposase
MMKKVHTIHLAEEEKARVDQIVKKGREQARVITRARVVLFAHEGRSDAEIASLLSLSVKTPYEIRKRYHQGGIDRALYDLARPGQPRKLTSIQEARVITIACTTPPDGYAQWTLDLLREETQKQTGIAISRSAIWKVCLRNELKPWREKNVGDFQDYTRV